MVRECADAVAASFPSWAGRPLQERAERLQAALRIMQSRQEVFTRSLTMENGKPLRESKAEFRAALNDAAFQIDLALRTGDRTHVEGRDGRRVGEIRHSPLGMVVLITPWNYPLATVLRKLVPALLWGNTVLCKPAEQTPLSPALFFQCLDEAGIPDGVARMLVADGPGMMEHLAGDPRLKGISFTGSTAAGRSIADRIGGADVRLQLEMGGKNAMVVLDDADLDHAVASLKTAAFTNAGQWCLATSRVLVQESVYEPFRIRLQEALRDVRVGCGFDASSTMGPLTTPEQYERASEAVRSARADGLEPVVWNPPTGQSGPYSGHYMGPVVFGRVPADAPLFREEVFGPVLALTSFREAGEALRLANASPYGLSFSVWTGDPVLAERFLNEVACGAVHHNLHTGHRHAAMPVTGWKESGRGVPECGHYARDFYTHAKAVYR